MPSRGGRPKTGPGYRDDAMLGMIEVRGKVAELVQMRQRHYREERDLVGEIDGLMQQGLISWRYGEIADVIAAGAAS